MSNLQINKTTQSQGINYEGNVTLKWIRKNKVIKIKKIKNTATNLMLRGIASFLLEYNTIGLIPKYLDIGTGSAETSSTMTNLAESILNPRVRLYTYAPELDGNSYIARFYTTIPATSVSSSQKIRELGLFGTVSDDSMLARIVVSDDDSVTVPDGTALFVEWDISISNK